MDTLKKFMIEFFPFDDFKEIGFFTEDMRNNYESQASKVCTLFGFKTVYEYGTMDIRCHLSYVDNPKHIDENGELKDEPFITRIENIYD